jgi:hypothetical protein
MASIRRWIAVGMLAAVATVGLLAQPAAALHGGAIADCGNAGTFALRTTPNSADFQSPPVNAVLLFEGGGTLSVLAVSRDGRLVWDSAATGMASNAVEEVTCSFTLANGVHVAITGVFTRR